MNKSDINILVVDDEISIAESLVKALVKSGYTSRHVRDADQALQELEVRDYHMIVIDCMLPRINGIELAKKIQEKIPNGIKTILISGIFKDQGFKKDAIEKAKALHYFEKPYDLQEVVNFVNKAFEKEMAPETPPLYHFFHKEFHSNSDELTQIINESELIHGYEVPIILSLLCAGKVSGELTLEINNDTTLIGFNKGAITKVLSSDTDSYFGVLLIENGFSTPEEIAKGLALESELPIGKRLWATNTLSPHAIALVHQEQLSIRLSKSIQPVNYKISFKKLEKENNDLQIEESSFHRYLNDWLSSKVRSDWLRNFFTPWSDNFIVKGPLFSQFETFKKLPLASLSPNITEAINNKTTIGEIIDNHKRPFTYQSLLFLLLLEVIKISEERNTNQNFEATIQRLTRFHEALKTKNFYEMLGVDRYAHKERIQQAFHNMALTLHPDKVPREAPNEVLKLTTEIFQTLSQANQTLTNHQSKQKYDFELEHGRAEQIMHSENLFERGCILLNNKKYNEACDTFDEVYQMNIYNDDFFIYYCWALLKRGASPSQVNKLLLLVEEFLSKIPQEKRHNSSYFYIKGLYLKLNQDFDKAIISFKHAFTLNPEFKPAQIEWMSLENQKKEQTPFATSLFNIFKKKSS